MASPAITRVGESRLAGAIARLLRWEARLLERTNHDAASRSAALRGLEWAADFARALELESCAGWLDALRERGADRPGHTPEAWSALGASVCSDLAAQLEEHLTLLPLASAARPWSEMAREVRAFEEPVAEPEPAADVEPAAGVAPLGDAEEPGVVDLASEPYRCGDRIQVPDGTRVPGDPALLESFCRALADWVGPYGVHADARNGRVELSGARPSNDPEPDRLSDAALEALRVLHQAASRLAAPLVVGDPEDGAVRWSVRLPAADDPRRLFAEAGPHRLALPWHAVVTYGLGEGGRSHVVLGRGLERIALALDWLHGLGPARETNEPALETIAFDTPALIALPHQVEAEDGGRFVAVELLPTGVPAALTEPAAPAESAAPTMPPAMETVQNLPPPADNPERSVPSALVADDSFTARVFLCRLLAMRGIAADEAEDGPSTRDRLAARAYDLVFVDADMPGGGALAMAESIAPEVRHRAIVLVRDDAERVAAQAAGFAHALFKPFAEDEVAATLRVLAEESRPGA